MAKKLQRRWKIGQVYQLEGTGRRRIRLVGRGKIGDREFLLFHPIRAVPKSRL
ncbi:MAG: hypothetical protein JO078_03600 [Candidatus Eremiobacteraeota bacterium]|nr:hypothetical protein [Candidatus Eremiobacteraeota bacterium]MBV9055722.1 hypothetical protein [Candidatus Eremiobacteraeota bacterium]MBV9699192.1 hypothetical protein [Candidatus Eremiobacteraeota bacterium]